jgi:primosomal replication protein N''
VTTQKVLQTLEQQINALAVEIEPVGHVPAQQARFDAGLFHTHGTRLRDYLAEVRQNLAQLKAVVAEQRTAQVAFVADRLVTQIGALQRELATLALRKAVSRPQAESKEDIYHRLAQHQDFERRLIAMIRDRESLLGRQESLAQQRKIQQELAALEGRLQRCRQALVRIERAVERKENGF